MHKLQPFRDVIQFVGCYLGDWRTSNFTQDQDQWAELLKAFRVMPTEPHDLRTRVCKLLLSIGFQNLDRWPMTPPHDLNAALNEAVAIRQDIELRIMAGEATEPPPVIPPTPTQWSTRTSMKDLMDKYGITRRTFQKMKSDGDIRQAGREQFSVRLDRVTPKPPPTPPKTATNSNQLRPTRTNSTNIGKESFRNGG